MKVTTVGIDLAKNVFQIHAVDERGKVVVRKQLKRDQMAPYFAKLERTVDTSPKDATSTPMSFSLVDMSAPSKVASPPVSRSATTRAWA